MLPDFPEIKLELADFANRYIRERIREHLGPLSAIRSVFMHEGDGSILYPDSGPGRKIRAEPSEVSTQVPNETMKAWTIEQIKVHLDGMALEMARQISRRTYDAIRAATQEAGTQNDLRGASLTAEAIIESFEKVEIPFKSDGSPILPQLHGSEQMAERMNAEIDRLKNDAVLRARFDDMIIRKRKEWYAREA